MELPSVEVVHMETPTFMNPIGAKGIGESGTIGSTPAVQSAVVDARQPPRRAPHRHALHPGAHLEGHRRAEADRQPRCRAAAGVAGQLALDAVAQLVLVLGVQVGLQDGEDAARSSSTIDVCTSAAMSSSSCG